MRPCLEEHQRKRSSGLVLKRVFRGLKNPFLCLFTYSSESACLPAHVWRPEDSLEVSDDNFGESVLSSGGVGIHLRLLDFLANALNRLGQLTALPGGVDMRC